MITGDSELTAANVNDQLELGPKEHLFLNLTGENKLVWLDDDGEKVQEHRNKEVAALQKKYTLCLTGSVLKYMTNNQSPTELTPVLRGVTVFARVSPSQKVI